MTTMQFGDKSTFVLKSLSSVISASIMAMETYSEMRVTLVIVMVQNCEVMCDSFFQMM
jgi:hypothetical protein